ncbi:GntR family transcriptional regulator [Burkholderia aenigmatica]|uniref:GntR family transcriptional regulator n=1 Tax=Burkholderia aenigmatica TaxID=2015348 RepID=UPI003B4318DD
MDRVIAPLHTERFSQLQIDLARRLAQQIVNGELQAGHHLSENWLAAEFEVSRTPVRRALQLLVEHGFVESRSQEGAFVTDTPPQVVPSMGSTITADELSHRILDDYAQGRLPSSWTVTEVLERYDAPRSVLHKALVNLASDGLVEKRKGHGWRFLQPVGEPGSIEESYRFRIILECGAIRDQSFRVDLNELKRLRDAHTKLLAQTAHAPNAAELFALGADFHETIARFSNNRFIFQTIQQQNQLRQLNEHLSHFSGPWHVPSCLEHLEIIEAFEQQDFEWAAALMRRHLLQALTRSAEI